MTKVQNLSLPNLFLPLLTRPVAKPAAKAASPQAASFASQLETAHKAHKPHKSAAVPPAGASLLEDVLAAADPQRLQQAQASLQNVAPPAAPETKAKAAMLALEGTMMTKFVDQMLPKSDHALYGQGVAGETWRGFEVDQLGKTLAAADPLNFSQGPGIKLSANAATAQLFTNDAGATASPNAITPFAG